MRFSFAVLLLLATAACSEDPAASPPGMVSDALTPTDTAEGEDVAGDDAVEPTQAEQDLCAAYCVKRGACSLPDAGPSCQAGCLELIAGDEGWANSVRCALTAGCDDVAGCLSDAIETQAACVDLCGSLDECGVFPSLLMGEDAAACTLYCSIQVKYNPLDFGTVAECINQGLATDCSDKMIVDCNPATNDAVCQQVCTSVVDDAGQPCNVPPAPYETQQACLADCAGWTNAQRWTARFCVGRTDCGQGAEPCFPPAEAPAEGALEACEALWSLCGGIPGYGLPKDPTVCGWILTGLSQGLDGFDLAGTPACLEATFPLCPDEPNFVFGCIVEEHEGCTAYCDKLVECSVPGVSADTCPATCNYGHATAPEATEAAISCVTETKCTELGKCFAQ